MENDPPENDPPGGAKCTWGGRKMTHNTKCYNKDYIKNTNINIGTKGQQGNFVDMIESGQMDQDLDKLAQMIADRKAKLADNRLFDVAKTDFKGPETAESDICLGLSPTDKEKGFKELDIAIEAYNDLAGQLKLSACKKLTPSRKKKLSARLKECGGLSGWMQALESLKESAWMHGTTPGWCANIDFLLTPSKFLKLMEGAYKNGSEQQQESGRTEIRQADGSVRSYSKADIEILSRARARDQQRLAQHADRFADELDTANPFDVRTKTIC